MATSQEYIEFVCEQLVGIENVRYKKMFGEYMFYVNDKPILLVCDNTVYVKKLPEIEELMSGAECGVPYDSAKEHYILDIEDRELTAKAVGILERITPVPKKKESQEEINQALPAVDICGQNPECRKNCILKMTLPCR